jgi:hypothetical protein
MKLPGEQGMTPTPNQLCSCLCDHVDEYANNGPDKLKSDLLDLGHDFLS